MRWDEMHAVSTRMDTSRRLWGQAAVPRHEARAPELGNSQYHPVDDYTPSGNAKVTIQAP